MPSSSVRAVAPSYRAPAWSSRGRWGEIAVKSVLGEQLGDRARRIGGPHDRLAYQDGVDRRRPQGVDVGAGRDSALPDHDRAVGDQGPELRDDRAVDGEGGEVAGIDADDPGAGVGRAL